MQAVIQDVFDRHFFNQNPENIEALFRTTYSSGFTQRPDLTVMGGFSGLEIACWDILGKQRDRPVWALLGGIVNEKLRAYSYLYPLQHHPEDAFWSDADMAAESAAALVNRGYTAVKFDPAGPYTQFGGHMPSQSDISRSVAFCEKIRAAVGDKADLLFGTHGQFSTAGAIQLGKALERFSPMWFEEPIPPDNLLEFAKVAAALRIPIATGERLTTKAEFATLLRTAGATIMQPALGRAGGIWEMKKMAAIAETFNAQVAPHLYAGPIEWAANIHLGVSIPNFLIAETIETEFHKNLIASSITVENGYIAAPSQSGLGIEVNEALARAHPYTGTKLHLEMSPLPNAYQSQ